MSDLVKDNLCSNDPRSAFYIELDDDPRPARVNCFCENCFSGKDKLAVRIAELEATLQRVKGLQRYTVHRDAYTTDNSTGKWVMADDVLEALGEAK